MPTMQILVSASSCHPASSAFVANCPWFELPGCVCPHCVSQVERITEDNQAGPVMSGSRKRHLSVGWEHMGVPGHPQPQDVVLVCRARQGCGELETSSASSGITGAGADVGPWAVGRAGDPWIGAGKASSALGALAILYFPTEKIPSHSSAHMHSLFPGVVDRQLV